MTVQRYIGTNIFGNANVCAGIVFHNYKRVKATGFEVKGYTRLTHSYHTFLRWTPHPVIVTIGVMVIVFGSSYIPIIPLLQGGGSS